MNKPVRGKFGMNHDPLQNLRKLVHIPEAKPLAGAQARAMDADVMQRDILVIRSPEIFLEPLFPNGKPGLARGCLRIR